VRRALVSSGEGWLDGEPEIYRLKPDIYAVNEDGDRPEKRQFCEAHGIEYRVLKRTPKEGLRGARAQLYGDFDMDPLVFEPFFRPMVWGGRRLEQYLGAGSGRGFVR